MAKVEPELAARLIIQTLPAAAAKVPGKLTYGLDVEGVGDYTVAIADGQASVTPGSGGSAEFTIKTSASGLAQMAAGASPLRLMMGGKLKLKGKRLRARKLRAMSEGEQPDMAAVIKNGGTVDPDLLYRSLPYLVDPEWTRGQSGVVRYEIGEGQWDVEVRDGEPLRVTSGNGVQPDAVARVGHETFTKLVTLEMSPTDAMRLQLTQIDGYIPLVTVLGRWMERAQGRDDAELEREQVQREIQARRAGSWGSSLNGAGHSPGQGDPAHESEGGR